MVTVYLTITLCMINSPFHCEDVQFKSNVESFHSCIAEGLRKGVKEIKRKGDTWKIKKWRCSHKAPDVGV